MYTAYCSPSLIKERLGNGDRIPIILYELNPLRDPNYRINHYRNDFNEISDRTLPYLKKYNNLKKKKNRKAKTAGKAIKQKNQKARKKNIKKMKKKIIQNIKKQKKIINSFLMLDLT